MCSSPITARIVSLNVCAHIFLFQNFLAFFVAGRDFIRQSGKSLEAQRVAAKEERDNSKKKRRNAGRGVEGKYVFSVQDVSKFVDGDKALFENVSFQVFQGYATRAPFAVGKSDFRFVDSEPKSAFLAQTEPENPL